MTLEEYFKTEYADGKIDHWLRAHVTDTGEVHIYMHPYNKSGNTTPMLVVSGNTVAEKQWWIAPQSAEILDPNSERGRQVIRNAAYMKPTTQGDPPPDDRGNGMSDKKPDKKADGGFWKKLGTALAEFAGQVLYKGPR